MTDCFPEALALPTGFAVLSLLCGYSIIVNGIVLRFLSASSAGSNIKRFPPASVPAAWQEPPQGSSYLKVSSDPGQKTDMFRHSPALENTRLWCLVGQTFLRSSKGDFPFPPCRQHTGSVKGRMANNNPAIGIMGITNMFLIGFLFSHGKSPFLRLWERAAALFCCRPLIVNSIEITDFPNISYSL